MPYEHRVALAAPWGAPAHNHDAWLDPRTGNGRTDPGPDGHVHAIHGWKVQEAEDGHTHELSEG
jgi:hypothetical protein